MALNPSRSSNPFGQTDEPDWISIPRSSSKASLSSMSSSPFEKVMLPNVMSSSASSTTPRKLPPPFDASAASTTSLPAKVGRMNVGDDMPSRGKTEAAPPPPPPRRQTAAIGSSTTTTVGHGLNRTQTQPLAAPLQPIPGPSHVSQLSQQLSGGKSAPPIARKPAHLTTTLSPLVSSSSSNGAANGGYGSGRASNSDGDDYRPPLPVRSGTGSSTKTPTPTPTAQQLPGMSMSTSTVSRKPVAPPKPPMGSTGIKATVTSAGAVSLPGMAGGDVRPSLPSRRVVQPQQASPQQQGSVDLLDSLDDGHDEVGGWETLQPSTRA